MPALAFMRLPAASTPICFIVTPASFRAAMAASAARSTVSCSGCLPNLVMWIPRIQTLSATSHAPWDLDRLEAEADGFGAVVVGADGIGRQLDLHPERHVVGVGIGVDDVAAHARAVAVDNGRHERNGDAWRGERHDCERAHLAIGADRCSLELRAPARRARIAPVEEPRSALDALVGFEMRVVAQHQVVHQRNRCTHAGLLRLSPLRSDPTVAKSSTRNGGENRSEITATVERALIQLQPATRDR